ncbi:hypothetical protein [Erythrobacter oryzae]|uniref:hypothetical protein n=1 Tax=Erythrobacter oryzae TaxID=3019556 RepID=UPI002555FDB6|nr:hypothetical protein [Erythrobacter sp. COR-2]
MMELREVVMVSGVFSVGAVLAIRKLLADGAVYQHLPYYARYDREEHPIRFGSWIAINLTIIATFIVSLAVWLFI